MNGPVYHRFAAAAIAVAACRSGGTQVAASTTPAPAAELAIPHSRLVAGETITWSVTFAGVQAARARMAIGQSDAGDKKQIVVRAEAQSAGLVSLLADSQESVTSWIDPASGVPTQTEFHSVDAGRTQRVSIAWSPGKAEQVIARTKTGEAPGQPQTRMHLLPASPVYDNLSGLAALRAWDAHAGARATMWAFAGSRLWRTVIEAGAEEDIDTAVGKVRSRKLTAASVRMTSNLKEDTSKPPRTWTMWISTDERRIPVRIDAHLDFGDVVVKCTSYAASESQD